MSTLLRPSEAARSERSEHGGLPEALRPAWAVIDLDRLERNFAFLRRRLAPSRILAVVKADGYGHGAVAVGRFLESLGVEWLGVALVEEGIELRREGARGRILVMGTCRPGQLPLMRRHRLVPTVSSAEQLRMWGEWVPRNGPPQRIHLKVDTGMSRLGLAEEELGPALEVVRRHPALRLDGLMSHLAEADAPESERNREQEARFAALLEALTPEERRSVRPHLANSAGALHQPAMRHSLVRLGLSLFGLDPARRVTALEPVMSVESRIVQLRSLPPGGRVGYGSRWTAERQSQLAVVPVGYADGYPWRLTNRAEALVGGRRVPVAGAVSMDMTLLDVTGTGAGAGDPVVLMGEQGEERIDAWELAGRADTIPYEILCALGLRLPRRYRRDGRDAAFDSRFSARRA